MLSLKETQDIIALYHNRFDEKGYDVTTVGWKNMEEQALRFKILSEIGELSGTSICDIGCGFGDLILYLKTRFMNFSYLGIDICDKLIKKAQELNPDYEFECRDILNSNFEREFDYFLLSGALSYRISDNMALTKAMLTKMFSLSKKGVAVNFLSSYANYQHIRNFHYSPEEIFAFSRTLTRFVTLRHDYPLYEFSIYLLK
jgi:trans-aconitate methyltransferase